MNITTKTDRYSSVSSDLHTIRDFLRWSMSAFIESDLFYGHGTDNAWDEGVHLVLQAVHLPLDVDERVLDSRLAQYEKERIVEWVKRRINDRVPLPYLTHKAWFAEMEFYVDERVIVPRSPFGELIRNHYAPWVNPAQIEKVLDLCTGSGCIGIATAHVFEHAEVMLVDISADAIEVAKKNIAMHHVADRVKIVKSDLFNALKGQKFDLIVSNPPYVDDHDIQTMPTEFRREPMLALEAGDDGLDLVNRILLEAQDYLTENGVLIVEVGNSQYALRDACANVPFTWLSFDDGGDGVFLLTREELVKYRSEFEKGCAYGG